MAEYCSFCQKRISFFQKLVVQRIGNGQLCRDCTVRFNSSLMPFCYKYIHSYDFEQLNIIWNKLPELEYRLKELVKIQETYKEQISILKKQRGELKQKNLHLWIDALKIIFKAVKADAEKDGNSNQIEEDYAYTERMYEDIGDVNTLRRKAIEYQIDGLNKRIVLLKQEEEAELFTYVYRKLPREKSYFGFIGKEDEALLRARKKSICDMTELCLEYMENKWIDVESNCRNPHYVEYITAMCKCHLEQVKELRHEKIELESLLKAQDKYVQIAKSRIQNGNIGAGLEAGRDVLQEAMDTYYKYAKRLEDVTGKYNQAVVALKEKCIFRKSE